MCALEYVDDGVVDDLAERCDYRSVVLVQVVGDVPIGVPDRKHLGVNVAEEFLVCSRIEEVVESLPRQCDSLVEAPSSVLELALGEHRVFPVPRPEPLAGGGHTPEPAVKKGIGQRI